MPQRARQGRRTRQVKRSFSASKPPGCATHSRWLRRLSTQEGEKRCAARVAFSGVRLSLRDAFRCCPPSERRHHRLADRRADGDGRPLHEVRSARRHGPDSDSATRHADAASDTIDLCMEAPSLRHPASGECGDCAQASGKGEARSVAASARGSGGLLGRLRADAGTTLGRRGSSPSGPGFAGAGCRTSGTSPAVLLTAASTQATTSRA